MAVRLAIVLVAAAAIVLLGSRLRDHDRCDSARGGRGARGALTSSCRDPDVIASASALLAAGRRAERLRLARESVRREPRSFVGWVALGLALRDRDPAGVAARAGARQGAQPALAGTAVGGRPLGRRSGRRAAAVLEAQDRALDEVVAGRRDRQRHRAERDEQAHERHPGDDVVATVVDDRAASAAGARGTRRRRPARTTPAAGCRGSGAGVRGAGRRRPRAARAGSPTSGKIRCSPASGRRRRAAAACGPSRAGWRPATTGRPRAPTAPTHGR